MSDLEFDLICVDDVVLYPAIVQSNKPWVRIISCAETELPDPSIPPHLSGLSLHDARSEWDDYTKAFHNAIADIHHKYNNFLASENVEVLPVGTLLNPSPYLNMLLTPKSIAYQRSMPLDEKHFVYLNGGVRKLPEYKRPNFPEAYENSPIIYLSYGSMGYADIEFTYKQLKAFNHLPFRVIATVGEENLEAYKDLADNIKIFGFLPQPEVIRQSELVIFHGGNNTFNEVLYYGKPSIVLPFAWDGFDNAVRVSELNIGQYIKRDNPLAFELPSIAHKLLDDTTMQQKLSSISAEMQSKPGTQQAAEAITKLYHRYK